MENGRNQQRDIHGNPIKNSHISAEELRGITSLNYYEIDIITEENQYHVTQHCADNAVDDTCSGLLHPGKFPAQKIIHKPVSNSNDEGIHHRDSEGQ